MVFLLYRLFPNIITIFGLCAGMTSIRASFAARWDIAVMLILIACFMDAIDGKIARLLNVDSVFGMHLDSLCDVLNFGLAPALILYLWGLNAMRFFGWLVVMSYVACIVLRLARFGSKALECKNPSNFFEGVPAPAGAILALMPIVISLIEDVDFELHSRNLYIVYPCYIFIIALLVISRVPTFSIKHLKINKKFAPTLMVIIFLFFSCLLYKPWIVLLIMSISYLLSIPFSAYVSYFLSCSKS